MQNLYSLLRSSYGIYYDMKHVTALRITSIMHLWLVWSVRGCSVCLIWIFSQNNHCIKVGVTPLLVFVFDSNFPAEASAIRSNWSLHTLTLSLIFPIWRLPSAAARAPTTLRISAEVKNYLKESEMNAICWMVQKACVNRYACFNVFYNKTSDLTRQSSLKGACINADDLTIKDGFFQQDRRES